MIQRKLQKVVTKYLFKGKVLIVYGARQVGKTTMVKEILKEHDSLDGYYNCELLSVKRQLESLSPQATASFLGSHKIIVLDEAQNVRNIGMVLKQLIDTYPDMQIIATGSSSFDLANKINEPLTGRAFEFTLYPLALTELYATQAEMQEGLMRTLQYGSYPGIILQDDDTARRSLEMIASQYLYKDVLILENIKKADTVLQLLELLALQVGGEVSINELATKLGVSRTTVSRYIMLLEKSFVIFRLRAFSRNLRKEITKKNKIYFYDVGIRNAILNKYGIVKSTDELGALFENLMIVERLKAMEYAEQPLNQYFWRTHDQEEIDYIEESNGTLKGFEFKWSSDKYKVPKSLLKAYKDMTITLVNRYNFNSMIS